jgi:hypothetical protein
LVDRREVSADDDEGERYITVRRVVSQYRTKSSVRVEGGEEAHLISNLTHGGKAPVENDSDTNETGFGGKKSEPLMSAVLDVIQWG